MKRTLKVSICMGICVLLNASIASAAIGYMKWCARWPTRFDDANYGEDRYTVRNTTQNTPARYAQAKFKEDGASSWQWEGYLDSNGCTPVLLTKSNTDYKFITYYTRYYDRRSIYVNPDAFEADGTYKSMTIQTGSDVSFPEMYAFFGVWKIETNMAQLAGEALYLQDSLDWPKYSLVYMSTDANPLCDYPMGTGTGGSRICIDSTAVRSDGSIYNDGRYKYVIGHEMGHVQANYKGGPGGPSVGSYSNEPWPIYGRDDYCNCYLNNPSNPPTTCVRSRTFIETAQQESWANFFSSSLQNYRSSTSGVYVHFGKSYIEVNGSPYWQTVTPFAMNLLERWKWMEDHCNSGSSDKGVIFDWMQFFWQVWTMGGSDKFESSMLSAIWSGAFDEYGDGGDVNNDSATDTDGGYDEYAKWDNIVDEMYEQISDSGQRLHFQNMGAYNGVNH